MLPALLLVAAGLGVLTAGADRLVLAAARISTRLGVSPILVGALVVGVGTSAPELLVGVVAATGGSLDLALGNVVGSNITNLTLVVGTGALVAPLSSRVPTLRREGLLMVGGSALFVALAWDEELGRADGVVLLAAMVAAVWAVARWSARDQPGRDQMTPEIDEWEAGGRSTGLEAVIGALAVTATLGGAELLVRGARTVASLAGLSDGLVGLTIVAIGTSLPELATAVAAARRREADLVVGNVLGSNIFNALLVGGSAAVVGPGVLVGDFRPPLLAMLGVALVAGVFAFTGRRIVRWEAAILIGMFLAALVYAA